MIIGPISLAESPPHPNATKVFTNWLLSREGQTVWQNNVRQPSLRVDLSRDGLDPDGIPRPDRVYVNGATEEFMATSTDEIRAIVDAALKT